MRKLINKIVFVCALAVLGAGFNSCIITDLNGGLLFEWNDDDNNNTSRDVYIDNFTREKVYVAIDVTLDDRDEPNWRNPLWDDHLEGNEGAIINLTNATNYYVWIYAETENTIEKRTGQSSHFYEGDVTDTLYISVFKEQAD